RLRSPAFLMGIILTFRRLERGIAGTGGTRHSTSSRPFRVPAFPSSRVPGSRQGFNHSAEGGHLQPPPSEFAEKGCEAEGVTGQVTCDDQVAPAFGAQALQFSKVDVDVHDQ